MSKTDPSLSQRFSMFQGDWNERLDFVIKLMRDVSGERDPQRMVQIYGQRMREIFPGDGSVSLSRRGLERPNVRVTRFSGWGRDVNPWKAKPENHVILRGGLLADLIWNEEAAVIDNFVLDPDDPSEPFLRGMKSIVAIPMFDESKALNMVVAMKREAGGFDREHLPERVWMTNLFGRATHNLVLTQEVKKAYESVDRELKIVADMQRALLPKELPNIPGLKLAAHYQTSRRAGGDYYDFFELPGDRWGVLIADVSGHGTPAAVMMAVTHSIAHTLTGHPQPPSRLLTFINEHLFARYTADSGTFVTAFYGIYDTRTRAITYASAGHCAPRIKRCSDGRVDALEKSLALPLGIDPGEMYCDVTETLEPGDSLVLYTDGITEARRPGTSDLFGLQRLDDALDACPADPDSLIRTTLSAVDSFTANAPLSDDRTLLIAKIG